MIKIVSSVLIIIVGIVVFMNIVVAAKEQIISPPSDVTYFSFLELEKYKTILLTIDTETGYIIASSQGAKDFYGYEDLTKIKISQINQLSEQEIKIEMNKALVEERNYFNFVHKLASGELREVEVNSYPMLYNGEEVLFSRIIDVTARNKTEAMHNFLINSLIVVLVLVIMIILFLLVRIKCNNARYQRLFENINSCVAVYKAVDDGKNFMFVGFNPAAEKTENITKEEIVGKKITEVFPNVEKFGLLEVLRLVYKTGNSSYLPISEYKDDRISGWRDNYVYKLPSNELLVVYEDVTERKQLQERLVLAKEEAEKANEAKSDFLANMSHEMRTPLNGVQGFLELLLDIEEDETKREYLSIIEESSQSLLEMIESILLIADIKEDKLPFKEKNINIKKVITATSKFYTKYAQAKGLDYQVEIDENIDKEIIVSELTLIFTIKNLLGNAIKFTEQGKIELRINNRPGNILEIIVTDTGIGIAKEKLEKLFDIFDQGEHYLTKKYSGTGVGLSIVKGLVDKVQGNIGVETKLGEGTKFIVEIPYRLEKKQ